jgi:hypothetical protein
VHINVPNPFNPTIELKIILIKVNFELQKVVMHISICFIESKTTENFAPRKNSPYIFILLIHHHFLVLNGSFLMCFHPKSKTFTIFNQIPFPDFPLKWKYKINFKN